jgi:hypothetical protein
VKVKAADTLYKGISFYLEEHPDLLVDLLKVVEARVDHSRVVDIMRRAGQLPLVKDYLASVQKNNLLAVGGGHGGGGGGWEEWVAATKRGAPSGAPLWGGVGAPAHAWALAWPRRVRKGGGRGL